VRGLVGLLENILAGSLVVELAGRGIESDGHLFARFVAGGGDGFENDLNGFLVGLAAWRETAFIANGGGIAALFEGRLQRVEDFNAPAESFAERGSTNGHGHEFLEINGAVGMGAAIEDVHHGDGEKIAGSIRGVAREVFVKRLFEGNGSGARGGHGDGEDGVGTETGFGGRAIEVDQIVVESALVNGVRAGDRFGDLGIDVGDGFEDALAEVFGLIAVAKFEGFVFAGGRARRNNGAAKSAGFEQDIGFDGGIAARVKDLAGVNAGDFSGHDGGVS